MLSSTSPGIGNGPTFGGGFAAPGAPYDPENNLLWEAGGGLLYGTNSDDYIIWQ